MLGLCFCARALSSCGKWGPLTTAASLAAEHRLQTHGLSSCGSRAQLLRGMWDPPRPGLEPVSPALAGGFSTTAPPGKPSSLSFKMLHTDHTAAFLPQLLSSSCNQWQHSSQQYSQPPNFHDITVSFDRKELCTFPKEYVLALYLFLCIFYWVGQKVRLVLC